MAVRPRGVIEVFGMTGIGHILSVSCWKISYNTICHILKRANNYSFYANYINLKIPDSRLNYDYLIKKREQLMWIGCNRRQNLLPRELQKEVFKYLAPPTPLSALPPLL